MKASRSIRSTRTEQSVFIAGIALIFLVGTLLPLVATGATLSEEDVAVAVESLLAQKNPAADRMNPGRTTRGGRSRNRLAKVERFKEADKTVGFLAELEPSGFLLVRADDRCPPLKLEVESGHFTNLPPAFVEVLLAELSEELDLVTSTADNLASAGSAYASEWEALLAPEEDVAGAARALESETLSVSILSSTSWGQGHPYNYYSPSDIYGPTPAGCVAIAMGQVLAHHNHPRIILGNPSYYDGWGQCRGAHSAGDAGLANYQWGQMPNRLTSSSSSAQIQAVSQLLHHCAVAVNMNFEWFGSGASPHAVAPAFRNHLGYRCENITSRSSYSSNAWYDKIHSNISNDLPVFYGFYLSTGPGGHAVMVDGARNGNQIHINMGWDGVDNAWYHLDNVRDSNGRTWVDHMAVFGIEPARSDSPPGRATPLSPANGSLVENTRQPQLRWSQVSGAEWYHLSVSRDGRAYHDQWLRNATSWTPGHDLPAGQYSWWIQTWNEHGLGPCSDEATFQIPSLAPERIVLVAPEGTIDDRTVSYQWNADSKATWYQLCVMCNGRTMISSWAESAPPNSGILSWRWEGHRPDATYRWWVRGWSPDGMGPWSAEKTFKVSSGEPGKPSLIMPGGRISDHMPTYRWDPASGAEWYQVVVQKDSSAFLSEWVQARTELASALHHPDGDYRWWVRAWNSQGGMGPWSDASAFSVGQAEHEYRISLTWDSGPRDLDAHLKTPMGQHVFYGNAGAADREPFAVLETDDGDGHGPEVISISRLSDGTYKLFVHNWSAEQAMAGCGARVRIHNQNGQLIYDRVAPTSGSGAFWHVCDINGNTVYNRNYITSVEP